MANNPLRLRIKRRLLEERLVVPNSAKRLCWMFNYSVSVRLDRLTNSAVACVKTAPIDQYTKAALLDDILAARMETLSRLSTLTMDLFRSDIKYTYREAYPIVCQKLKQFVYPDYSNILARYALDINKCDRPS